MSHEIAARHLLLGERAMEKGALREAEANFRCAIRLTPGDAESSYRLSLALSAQAKTDEALQELLRTLTLNPNLSTAYVLLSSLYQRQGEFANAIRASEDAIKLNPRLSKPYTDIVHCKRVSPEDGPLLQELERMAEEDGRSIGEKVGLLYALGKAENDLARFERATSRFDAANVVARKAVGSTLRYEPAEEAKVVDLLISRFSGDFFERYSGFGSPSELPVFIIGMIRSGTTLLNSLLSSHPEIATAGELTFWEEESPTLQKGVFRGTLIQSLFRDAADRYRRKLREIGLSKPRVIDKMPINYVHVGLIRTAFPNARFIHMRRHPVDTCLSIYMTEFGLEPPRYAFSRENIVDAYRQYQRLMDHWRSVLPSDRFIEVDYENLVLDKDPVLHRLVEFLGLKWTDAQVGHESNPAEIVTPSRWQARQPVYTSSLNRWKNYEPWLGEFRKLMETA